MFDNDEIKKLIAGTGALGEISAIYFKTLIANGIDTSSAAYLTGEFVKHSLDAATGE